MNGQEHKKNKSMVVCRQKLRQLRRERGLSLTELAVRAGISTSYLSEVEHGRKSPSLSVLHRIAAALNLEPASLLQESGTVSRITPGERVRLLRTERKLTLAALAEQAGITPSYLSEIERGRANPAFPTLLSLAAALDVSLTQLWGPLAGLGQRLRQVREEQGLSQAELALRARVSAGLVGQVERGEVQPSLDTVEALAAVLGVSPCFLIQEEDPSVLYSRLSPCVRQLLEEPRVQTVLERLCTCSQEELRFILEFIDLYKSHHKGPTTEKELP
ncbi:MAG: helix-turn-helix domain-containing protein [bacterium]